LDRFHTTLSDYLPNARLINHQIVADIVDMIEHLSDSAQSKDP
jgi:hypothetical protein